MTSRTSLYVFFASLLLFTAGWFAATGTRIDLGLGSTSSGSAQIAMESPERLARIQAMAETWPKEPDYSDNFNALNPSAEKIKPEAAASAAAGGTALLPPAENGAHDLVAGYCSGCHSLDIVKQQHATKARWQQLLVWMEEKQSMPPLPADDEAKVIEYLAANFGAAG